MITHRSYKTRGNPRADWIDSHRTFSFPGYFNPEHMNFGDLRTINDDRVQPGGHVPPHEHKNMEIFGYVVKGVCRHTDNQGNVIDVPAGAVQRMSAGRGIIHTEGNASETPNRYLQLWISPNVTETEPIHEWYHFTREDKLDRFCDITEKLPIKQDARLLAGIFGEICEFNIDNKRKYYLYIISGESEINGKILVEGDGLSYVNENVILINPVKETEIILFDMK